MKVLLGSLIAVAGLLPLAASAVDHPVTVNSNGFTFSPATITANVGDTVTFTNAGGGFMHNVVSDPGAPQTFRCAAGCDGAGGNGNLNSGNWTAVVTITTTGTIGYHCEAHGSAGSGMFGTINVPTPVDLQKFEVK